MRTRGLAAARLRRFFTDRRPVTLAEAAAVLRVDRDWITAQLDPLAAPEPDRAIPWSEIAALVREVLTPVELEAVLGDLTGFPPMLRVVQVRWRIPLYIVVALERRTKDDRASDPSAARRTIEATAVRSLELGLDLALDSDLIRTLSRDPEFRRAVHFPEHDD